MSVEIWENPNDPKPEKTQYPIGTADFEYTEGGFSKLIGDAIRSVYRGLRLPLNLLLGAIDGNGAACPTYGLWGGAGWNAGDRTPEGAKIAWETAPCYTNSIRDIETNPALDTKTCYSLVDAICKTHDWRYYDAEQQYKAGLIIESDYKAAILDADLDLLKDINTAYETGSFAETEGPWEHKIYTGILNNGELVLDSAESVYLTGLVPLFMATIATVDIADVVSAEAKAAVKSILSYITIDEATFENPENSLKKTIYSVENGFLITREESSSNINAWIIDLNSDAKPVNINIAYGEGSTKAEDLFVIDDGVIRINSGVGHNEITILGATNDTITNYTFEIADGGGNDTYYLDSNFDYKLIDSEANAIFIEDDNGKWTKINSLRENAEDNSWESVDESITLTGNTITLDTGSTINLGANFESGDFGINLLDAPANPVTNNPITGDLMPIDFDPAQEGIQTQTDQWGNVRCTGTAEPGREDGLYDTTANDKILAKDGDDGIVSSQGGNDWLLGGNGDDFVIVEQNQNSGNDILEGNAGSDIVAGGTGNDRVFGDNYGEMEQLLSDGETAQSINTRGDVVSGGAGDDYVYGVDAADILFGGLGKDLLVGGGGNDAICGDNDYVSGIREWSYTITSTPSGNTIIYALTFFGIEVDIDDTGTIGDGDVIYGGTGNDYVDGGGGDDEIYGGAGNDSLFGSGGYDFIVRLEFQKRSALKFVSRTIPHSGGYETPQPAAGFIPVIEGGEGDDAIKGDAYGVPVESQGGDYIDGGAGNDLIWGNAGNDDIFGGDNNDTLYGEGGKVLLFRRKLKYQNTWRRLSQQENLRRAA